MKDPFQKTPPEPRKKTEGILAIAGPLHGTVLPLDADEPPNYTRTELPHLTEPNTYVWVMIYNPAFTSRILELHKDAIEVAAAADRV